MTDVTALDKASCDLGWLEQQHAKLLKKLEEKVGTFRNSTAQKNEFVDDVSSFLKSVADFAHSTEADSAGEFVRRIASEWQLAFTTKLQVARNVSAILQVSDLPSRSDHGLPVPESKRMGREAVESWIRERASEISRLWKLQWATQLLKQLEQNPAEAHSVVLIPPNRTPVDDWNEACAYLAHEVYEARIDLALQLGVQSLDFLTNVWLEDVKRLKAYFVWELEDFRHEDSQRNYYQACKEIHKRLLDQSIKADPRSFAHIADWVRTEFLSNDRLSLSKPLCRATIERKAHRLWERTGCEDARENWRHAENYVREFYENLIPAVVERNQLAVVSLLSAAAPCADTGTSCELVNSLEAGLVLYFLDPQLMGEFFEGHATYL